MILALGGFVATSHAANPPKFRNALISWYSDTNNGGRSDAELRGLIDHLKAVGYDGVTFLATVNLAADGTVLDTVPRTRMWQFVDYASQRGMGTALQISWTVSDNTPYQVLRPPFSIPTFLVGARNTLRTLAALAQAHGMSMLVVGFQSNILVTASYRAEWATIIGEIRSAFSGLISFVGTYRDNDIGFRNIGIWDLVDVIGVLLRTDFPGMPLYDIAEIQAGYFYRKNGNTTITTVTDLINLSRRYNKPLLFGYFYFFSLDNALDGRDPTFEQALQTPSAVNAAAQIAAYRASLELFAKNLSEFIVGINFGSYEPWVYNTFRSGPTVTAEMAAFWNMFKVIGALAGPTTNWPGTPTEQLISQYLKQPWGYHTTTETNGGPGDDIIYVGNGDNVIRPGGGRDEIVGTRGNDIVVFPGKRSEFTITATATGTRVSETAKPANVATLTSIGTVQFDDSTVTLIPGRLTNLSILSNITATDSLLTVGTVIGGANTSGTKPLLIRSAGPSLGALGVPGTISDPRLEVFSGQTLVAANDDWNGTAVLSSAFAQVGAFAYSAPTSKDAAIFNATMPSGAYSVQISGAGGATGAVIAELYDATPASSFTTTTPRLINVSVLKQINRGEILTAGFVIGGRTSKQVLIRAVGPTLAQPPFGITTAMADPKLELFSEQTSIGSNDNWAGAPALSATAASVGAFALSSPGSKDAALLVTLVPGNYAVQVTGVEGSAGLVIAEVYEVP